MTEACADTRTDLSLDEALVVLEPYFEVMRERYLAAGLERCSEVELYSAAWVHDSARHFAACTIDGDPAIIAAPELAELDPFVVLAVFAHEFGHAVDYLYPGEFALRGDGPAVRITEGEQDPKHWRQWLRWWKTRDDDTLEFTADAIAEHVLGVRYGYQGPCSIQSFHATAARPRGLR